MQPQADDQPRLRDPLHERHVELLGQADAHAQAGDHDRAQSCYGEAVVLAPDQPASYVGLGTVHLHAGRLDEAEWAFRLAQRVGPACAEAHGGMAMVHQHRRDFPAAFEMYLQCLELDGDNLVALLGLFQTSCQMGTFSMITRHLETFLHNHPDDVSVLFCLATLYARDGRLAPAREVLIHLLDLEPEQAEAAQLLAAVQERLARSAATASS